MRLLLFVTLCFIGILADLIEADDSQLCPPTFWYDSEHQACMAVMPKDMCDQLLETGVKGMWSGGDVCYLAANTTLSISLTNEFLCGGEDTPFEPCIDSPGHCCFIGSDFDCEGYWYTKFNKSQQVCRAALGKVHARSAQDVKCPFATIFMYDAHLQLCKAKNEDIGNNCFLVATAYVMDGICYASASQIRAPKRYCPMDFLEDLGVCSKTEIDDCNGEVIGTKCFLAPNRLPESWEST